MFKLPPKVKHDISEYGATLQRFLAGELSPARFAGVRVPWGNYSQRGGNLYMARIRVPAGILSPRQLKALAFCARDFGNGVLHITTRQDVQIHEIKAGDIFKVHDCLKEFDLSSRGGGGNTVRNITACYLAGACPEEAFDVSGDATAVTEKFLTQDTSFTLPRKFKIAFSGCVKDCARCMVNDAGLLAVMQDGVAGYRVFVGGGLGASSRIGTELERFVARDQIGQVLEAVRNVFHNQGERKNKHRNRLRFLVEQLGVSQFKALYQEELKRMGAGKPIVLPKVTPPSNTAASGQMVETDDPDFRAFIDGNVVRQKQPGLAAVRLRIPRGDLEWKQAEALAALMAEFRDAEIRTTQDQDLCLVHIPQQDLRRIYDGLQAHWQNFLHPGTLLDVAACKGSRTCNLGLCNSPGLAQALEEMIEANFVGKRVFNRVRIRLNGCPNSCGHHPLGAIGFVGAVRRVEGRPVPHYKLLLGGKCGIPETRLAKDTKIHLPARNIPAFLKEFLDRVDAEAGEQENMEDYLVRRGSELAAEIKDKYQTVPSHAERRELYVDWGGAEEFSMQGLGPGECGAGVIDMIEADLADAAAALQKAGDAPDPVQLQSALFYTARALLVVRGSDPKQPEGAFLEFLQKFIGTGIASPEFAEVSDIYQSLHGASDLVTRKEAAAWAARFLGHITELYKRMDPSFNFPAAQPSA